MSRDLGLIALLLVTLGCLGCRTEQSEDDNDSDGPFRRMPSIHAGSAPASLALADFDADGALDMVVANTKDNTLTVVRGGGDGSFHPSAVLATGNEPRSVATSDLDGDGDIDIAVVNGVDATLGIYANQGDGTFAAAVEHPTGASPEHVVATDIDHDSRPDLLVVSSDDDSLAVFLADQAGGFLPRSDFPAGTNPVRLTLVDLNDDANLDVVTATRVVPPTVSVILGDGTGAFGAVEKFKASNRPGIIFPIAPLAITSGDVDGDGHRDVVVGNRGLDILDGEVWLLAGDGSGKLAVPEEIPGVTVLAPAFIDLVDFDGDGRLDVIEADHDPSIAALVAAIAGDGFSVCLALGDGLGSFVHDACMTTGDYPYEVATGHLNDDGKLDFVTADAGSDSVSVYLAR
jgi:hypothetical protein